jgi:hypothetical protein
VAIRDMRLQTLVAVKAAKAERGHKMSHQTIADICEPPRMARCYE